MNIPTTAAYTAKPQFSGKKLNFWAGASLVTTGLASLAGSYGMNHWTQTGQTRTALHQQVDTIQTLNKLVESKKNSPRQADYQILLQKELADTVYLLDQSVNVANGRPSIQPDQYWKQVGLKVDELLFSQDLLKNAKDVKSLKDAEALYEQWTDRVLVKVIQGPGQAEAKKAEAKAFFQAIDKQENWQLGLMIAMLSGLGLGSPMLLYSAFQKKQAPNKTEVKPPASGS
jgi:hypothetical protein